MTNYARRPYARRTTVSLIAGAALLVGAAAPASAANQVQDGLVNVAVGDIIIRDIRVGVAAQVLAQVCGLKVGPVAILGRAVDSGGAATTVCTIGNTPLTLTQN